MKTKNTIEIVETPIIDSYEFNENNGIINPAFLEAHPGLEEDNNSSRSLVNTDYRQNSFKNGKTFVHYPSPLPVTTTKPITNGTTIASSWVYEFNNGCSSTLRNQNNMSGSSNSLTNMYRSAYGYNDQPMHLSYEMDLNRDHRKLSNESRFCPNRCCPTIVRIFVWTIIVLSLLGIAFSIAFIIYIERFAADECCSNNSTTNSYYQNTGEPKVTPNSGFNYTLSVNTTTAQDMTTTISYSKSFFSTNGTTPSITESTDNSSPDLLVTNSSLAINDQNPILKLNDSKTTENSKIIETTISVTTTLKPDITPKMKTFLTNGTTPFETTTTETTTTTIPTTSTTIIPTTTSTTDFTTNKSSIRSIVSEMTTTASTASTTITPTTTMMLTSWTSNQSEMTTHQTDLHSRQMLYKEQQNTYKMNSTENSVEITTEAMNEKDYDIIDSIIKSITSDEQNTTVPNN